MIEIVLPFIGPMSFWELIAILIIVLLLFGARRLPDVARGIAKSIVAFKKGLKEGVDSEKAKDIGEEKENIPPDREASRP